ncbi:MAG: lipoate protein ligase C-terminal domain-containing protein [Candidatus Bathyarchaeia archaeon]|nr:lipoate--protein ligase family protein [Candidatus Bathyarchaeota archaeon]
MLVLKAEYKVEGGKLIKVQLEREDNKIKAIKITGDFFMHPEELIDELEKSLIGCSIEESAITEIIKRFIEEKGVILLGVAPEDFAKCIVRAGGSSG